MSNDFAVEALWSGVTRDQNAEIRHELLVRGKVAVATYWPFLAAAQSRDEFDHRFALQADRINDALDPRVAQQVVDSLAEDWETLHTARAQEFTAKVAAAVAAQPPALVPGQEFWHVASQKWMTVVTSRDGKIAAIDPSDAWRYNHYQDMNPPVDNGPLQGPDGFVTDPQPDNTGMSNQVIQERQLTPGAWTVTPGTEWPVKPNAGAPGAPPRTAGVVVTDWDEPSRAQLLQGMATYDQASQPHTAGRHVAVSARDIYGMQSGDEMEIGDNHRIRYHAEQAMGDDNKPAKGYTVGHYEVTDSQGRSKYFRHTPYNPKGWASQAKPYAADQAIDHVNGRTASQAPPRQSSVRVAGEGVVATPGPNPNYFSQGTNGLIGEPAYPVNPSGNIEPSANNLMDAYYGEVPPVMSTGTDGSQNGPYSQANPSASAPTPGPASGPQRTDQGLRGMAPQASVHVAFNESHVTHYVNWAQSEGRDSDHPATLKAYEKQPGVGRAHANYLADQLYIGGGEEGWRRNASQGPPNFNRQASTDGRIVGHCDHCNEPLRVHSGDGGPTHLRHLHNNSNKCSDGRQATSSLMVGTVANPPIESSRKTAQFFDPTDRTVIVVTGGAHHHDVEIEDNPDVHPHDEDRTKDSRWSCLTCDDKGPWTDHEEAKSGGSGHGDLGYRFHAAMEMGPAPETDDVNTPTATDPNMPTAIARRVQADGRTVEAPSAANPTGRGTDEFAANTFDNFVKTRPMQAPTDRNINTPVMPAEQIRTLDTNRVGNGDPVGMNQNEDSREASLRTLAQIMEA